MTMFIIKTLRCERVQSNIIEGDIRVSVREMKVSSCLQVTQQVYELVHFSKPFGGNSDAFYYPRV